MTYISYQGNDSDCGFASLKMLLANKTKNKSYLYIRKPSKKKDYSFYDLIKIAKNYGILLSSYEMPVEDYKDIPPGSLVMIKDNHLVYLKRVGKHYVTYYDPAIGKVRIKTKEFENRWKGLVIECTNALGAKDLQEPKPRFIPLYIDVIYYLIIAAVFVSLMTGFYLIQDNTSVLLTMAFLVLFAIAQLVENWYLIKEINLFDKKYLSIFFSQKRNQNKEKYRDYIEYRNAYFVSPKILVSGLILITAFSVLLTINDYRNIFVFLILLLLKLLDNSLFARIEKDDIKDIETIESIAFESETTLVHSLTRANKLASKLGLTRSFRKVAYLFVCLSLAIGMMVLSGVTSTNFIIFHFGIYYVSSQSMDNIINFFNSSKDRKIKRARFLDDCDL